MNYYNPYFYSMPSAAASASKVGLLSKLFGKTGTTLSGILSGTQKVLNIANQAIPLVKQVGPMMNNAKTMFKIMNEFKRSDIKPKTNSFKNQTNLEANNINPEIVNSNNTSKKDNVLNEDINSNSVQDYNNGLTFFI